MARFLVGTGQHYAYTHHFVLSSVAARVNRLVDLGYQGILITDTESGWKCKANDVVTEEQLREALHTDEVSIAHLLKRRFYDNKRYRKLKGHR